MKNASEILTRKSKEIMKRWELRARKEVTSAFGTTSLALQDALEEHLKQLAGALQISLVFFSNSVLGFGRSRNVTSAFRFRGIEGFGKLL